MTPITEPNSDSGICSQRRPLQISGFVQQHDRHIVPNQAKQRQPDVQYRLQDELPGLRDDHAFALSFDTGRKARSPFSEIRTSPVAMS